MTRIKIGCLSKFVLISAIFMTCTLTGGFSLAQATTRKIGMASCFGVFKAYKVSQQLNLDIEYEFDSSGPMLKILNLRAQAETTKYLRFLFLPTPDAISNQNPNIVGVNYIFDPTNKNNNVFLMPFRQLNHQLDVVKDQRLDYWKIQSNWKPLLTSFSGLFLPERTIEFWPDNGKIVYRIQAKDFYDEGAVQSGIQDFKIVAENLKAFDHYDVQLDCTNKKDGLL